MSSKKHPTLHHRGGGGGGGANASSNGGGGSAAAGAPPEPQAASSKKRLERQQRRAAGARPSRGGGLLGAWFPRPPRAARAPLVAAALLLVALYLHLAFPGLAPAARAWAARRRLRPLPSEPAARDDEGGRTLGPSFGVYPRGCRWREVTYDDDGGEKDGGGGSSGSNVQGSSSTSGSSSGGGGGGSSSSGGDPSQQQQRRRRQGSSRPEYLFYDEASRRWSPDRPAACALQGHPAPGPRGWAFLNGSPRTEVTPHKTHVVYRNLWHNGGRWYALVDGPKAVDPWHFSRNQEIRALHFDDARAFAGGVKWRVVTGDTLLFDYIFFTHPTAIGHWWEMIAPLYSVLKRVTFGRPVDNFVLLHLQRRHLPEWVRAMLAVALGVPPGGALPPVLLQEPQWDHPTAQMAMPLEGVPPDEWVVFEKVLIVRDVFTGGRRSFATAEDAREFRAAVYGQYGLPPPRPRAGPSVPRTVTFQRKRANRRVVNEAALLELLRGYGRVRVVEFDATSSLQEQLMAMRGTGLFVSAHTSNLANAPLLQPGSAVLELIPRHWSWMNLDRSFKDQTQAMGDLHHWAWRANRRAESTYIDPRDAARFANWTGDACRVSEPCTEAQTNTDLTVDVAAVKRLLDSRLPMVWAGRSVASAELPWPPVES